MGSITIGSEQLEVELLPELGARLHRLRAFGHELLRTPPDPSAYAREPFFWGGYVMAPWCNRIAAGPTRAGEGLVDLPANFPDGTAIHGQVQALAWESTAGGRLRVQAGGRGWPWRYKVEVAVNVDGARLQLALELTNLSNQPMPGGIGIHPWFRRPLEVAINADRVFVSNQTSAADAEPVSGEFDLRRRRAMPPDLDATWGALDPSRPAVELAWPRLGIEGVLRASPEAAFICAASPGALGAVAIEPQTHAPAGLRRLLKGQRGAMAWLEPNSSLRLRVELSFTR